MKIEAMRVTIQVRGGEHQLVLSDDLKASETITAFADRVKLAIQEASAAFQAGDVGDVTVGQVDLPQ